ncbi:MAG TPA: AMP-binding protein, partial [Candidatus Acidoferrum sp.]|nr:AMP-binding protein [Candidatus Acidoferrum sp.]
MLAPQEARKASTPDSQRTVGEAIRNRARLQPEHAAVISPGFAPLSYRDLQRLIDDVHAALRANGFDRNARIAIGLPNGPQAALAIVAVACSAVSIPVNPRQTVVEIEASFGTLQPVAIILLKGSESAARKAAESKGVNIIELTPSADGTLAFDVAIPRKSATGASAEPDEPNPDAPAFILQTSGTAAEPKLIPFSHRNMLAAASRVQAWFNLTPEDRCLAASPVFYSHGLKVTVFTPLLTGGTVAFPSDATKFDFL